MSLFGKKLKIFNFWSNKAAQSTLEDVVKSLQDLRQEFQDSKKEFQEQVEKERQRANEAEEKLKQQESGKNVIIHYYPGKELFVIIDSDTIYSNDVSEERFLQLKTMRENKDIVGILRLLTPEAIPNPVVEVEKEIEAVERNIESETNVEKILEKAINEVDILVQTGDFEVKGDSMYLKGIDRSIPKGLRDKFSELVVEENKEELEAWKNFWRWVVLNPNARAAEEFYVLLEKYNVHVTKEGFILAYRWVYERSGVDSTENKPLIQFISSSYVDVKKRKKGPKNFEVHYDVDKKEYFLSSFGKIPKEREGVETRLEGNLQELYTKLPEMQNTPKRTFTDGHTQTMTIRIGQEVRMNRKDCDESAKDCSRGLHACFQAKDYHSHGSTKLLVAICPRDIVSVPYNTSKFRSCRYLPLAILKRDEDDTTFLQKGEGLNLLEDYFKLKVDELKEQAETKTVKELTVSRVLPANLAKQPEKEVKEELTTTVQVFQDQIEQHVDYVEYINKRIRPVDEEAPAVADEDEDYEGYDPDKDPLREHFEDEDGDDFDDDEDEDDY